MEIELVFHLGSLVICSVAPQDLERQFSRNFPFWCLFSLLDGNGRACSLICSKF